MLSAVPLSKHLERRMRLHELVSRERNIELFRQLLDSLVLVGAAGIGEEDEGNSDICKVLKGFRSTREWRIGMEKTPSMSKANPAPDLALALLFSLASISSKEKPG
jgi:hypothetical protein